MYTIGQVSEMFDIPVSTLRYYDNEGLFPNLKRTESGIRKFDNTEIESIRIIECLKKSSLEIKDIKKYMLWCNEGSSTFKQRLELFENQKKSVELEIDKLEKTLSMLKYKCWFYETAIKDGDFDKIHAMLPDKLPKEIQELYNKAMSE